MRSGQFNLRAHEASKISGHSSLSRENGGSNCDAGGIVRRHYRIADGAGVGP